MALPSPHRFRLSDRAGRNRIIGEGRVEEAHLTPGAEPRWDGTVAYLAPDPADGSL
ncbi:hypothetical protein NN6n1_02470 [Shinella zoogloeoides]